MWRKYFFPERANIVSERLHNAFVALAVAAVVVDDLAVVVVDVAVDDVVATVVVAVAHAVVVLSLWCCLFKSK